MELTPQQIDAARTEAEIDRQVKQSLASMPHDATEKRALAKHPPVFRSTQPVPPLIRNAEVQLAKAKRPPKIKKHVLP
jgi:hypothetical protein